MTEPKPTIQDLCDEIQKMGDVLACYAVNKEGKLLGASYGEFQLDDDLREEFSHIASGVWTGLGRVTNLGGPLQMVSATYKNFKILGLPIKGTNMAILLTIETKLDSYRSAERTNDFVAYWLKVNHYTE